MHHTVHLADLKHFQCVDKNQIETNQFYPLPITKYNGGQIIILCQNKYSYQKVFVQECNSRIFKASKTPSNAMSYYTWIYSCTERPFYLFLKWTKILSFHEKTNIYAAVKHLIHLLSQEWYSFKKSYFRNGIPLFSCVPSSHILLLQEQQKFCHIPCTQGDSAKKNLEWVPPKFGG